MEEKDLIGLYEAILKQKGILRDETEAEKEVAPVEVLPVESMFLPALYDYLEKMIECLRLLCNVLYKFVAH